MAGRRSEAPIPPKIAQKMMTGEQALGQGHRQRAKGVGEQAEHIRPLATDEVADFAVDQDERGGNQRLERDRRLDTADRRAEILDHGRDRHVHDRRVDDQHEHRHGQQDARGADCRRPPRRCSRPRWRSSSCPPFSRLMPDVIRPKLRRSAGYHRFGRRLLYRTNRPQPHDAVNAAHSAWVAVIGGSGHANRGAGDPTSANPGDTK